MADLDPLPLPSARSWASVGLTCEDEIHGGHQSRVLGARRGDRRVVVKLTDPRLVDEAFARRVELVASLADAVDHVVGPVPIGARLITELDGWLAVAYPLVGGRVPDLDRREDVERLARTLADLHAALAAHAPVDLPVVAPLRDDHRAADRDGFGPHQLLHGDYSADNARIDGASTHVLDLDDCGYGPVEVEVGNTLYMALFDAWASSGGARYDRFRTWFVDAYREASGRPVADDALEAAVDLRVDSLRRWVDDPEHAPVGIRTAPASWRATLRSFVGHRAEGAS